MSASANPPAMGLLRGSARPLRTLLGALTLAGAMVAWPLPVHAQPTAPQTGVGTTPQAVPSPAEAHTEPTVPTASPSSRREQAWTIDDVVRIALQRNRDVIAAKLRVDAAQLDRVAASVYPNPTLSYGVGNIVVGAGNPNNVQSGAPANPSLFQQPVQSVGISQTIDVWAKRSARARVADLGVETTRLEVEDALRQIVHDVRIAFTEVLREQSERALSHEMRDRYADTVRLSQSRFRAGEISETELRKIELEGLKYHNRALDADMQLSLSRTQLAALLGLRGVAELGDSFEEPRSDIALGSVDTLATRALADRPDMRALREARTMSDAMVTREHREVLPDVTVGLSYTHSAFLASGDNPNALGLSVSVPLPVFDRNRAGIGRAELEARRVDNEIARLDIQIRREIAEAFRRYEWAVARLDVFEQGRMLERAEKALQVSERSYRAGASSLLELLEAERTYLETKADYLVARDERSRAAFDLTFALGSQGK